MNNKVLRIVVLATLIIVLFCILYFSLYTRQIEVQPNDVVKTIEALKTTRKLNDELITNISLNDEHLLYNKKLNTYFYIVDNDMIDKYIYLNTKLETDYRINYIIDNQDYLGKMLYHIAINDEVKVFIYSDDSYFETKIKFTNLPIINIDTPNGDIDDIESNDKTAKFTLYSKNKKASIINSDTYIRIRGGTSTIYPKKSYRLSLYKENNGDFEQNKISLLGMRKDEDWILDALYVDYSKVRNKLASDLWNQINSYESTSVNNDLNTEFVEVYINEEYNGLYVLKEPVDQKTVQLNKKATNRGVLIKGVDYIETDFSKTTNINSEVYGAYELKYPNNLKNASYYWNVILSKMQPYYGNKIDTDDVINSTFEVDNLIDYRLLTAITRAVDNVTVKNIYLSLETSSKTSKIVHTPWDLDQTFSYTWSGEGITKIDANYNNYSDLYVLLFEDNAPIYNKKVKNRYYELREKVITEENINHLIDEYYQSLKYVYHKDSDKWLEFNLEDELQAIKEWTKKRIAFLDQYIGEMHV